MGVLDVLKSPFKWMDQQYNNAAFGQGWEQRAQDEAQTRRLQTVHQANEIRRQSQAAGNADVDQRLQNMKSLLPLIEGQLYSDPEAEVTPVNLPMPDGVTWEQLVRATRGNARMRQIRERGAELGNQGREHSMEMGQNRDERAAAEEERKAGREPLTRRNIESQIDTREHPRARPQNPRQAPMETEATYQRDFNTARTLLTEQYKAGERESPASEAEISSLAEQIRNRRRGQMGGAAPGAGATTPPAASGGGGKIYVFGGQKLTFDQLPPAVQAEVKKRGL